MRWDTISIINIYIFPSRIRKPFTGWAPHILLFDFPSSSWAWWVACWFWEHTTATMVNMKIQMRWNISCTLYYHGDATEEEDAKSKQPRTKKVPRSSTKRRERAFGKRESILTQPSIFYFCYCWQVQSWLWTLFMSMKMTTIKVM